jgi:hypothetical protein
MIRLLALLSLFALMPELAAAQDQKSVLAKPEAAKQNTPIQKWIDAENALIDPLSDKDKESFFILRNKHSIIRVIRVVEKDIQNAVKSCGKNNPDMKDAMNDRFAAWQKAVDPILDAAQIQLDKDLAAQKIVKVKDAKKVLKLNDEAYEFGEKQIVKNPVTTKEACEDLVKSMDRTEDEMIQLLQQTLLPESVIRQRAEAQEKEKEKQKQEAAKESPSKKAD